MAAIWRSPVGRTQAGQDVRVFRSWCKKRKVLWDSCDIQETTTTGRAVVAAQDIAQDAVVVEVPDDAVLMGENCSIADALAEYGLLKPAEDAILEVQGLILAVMYEKALGPKSRWSGYLSFLPEDMTHMPVYWEESELAELRGTAAADKMEGRVQHPGDAPTRVKELFEEVVLPFCQAFPDITRRLMAAATAAAAAAADSDDKQQPRGAAKGRKQPRSTSAATASGGPPAKKRKTRKQQQQAEEEEEEEMTEEAVRSALWPLYAWATAAVASYSFKLGDDLFEAMVPVWDALNHVTDKVNVRLHHDAARGVLQMIATQAIPRGAEVVNCYGQLSSAELLRGYGFVEQDNSKEHAQVPAHFLLKAAAAAAAAAPTAAGSSAVEGKPAAAVGGAAAEQGEEDERLQLWSDSGSDSDSDDFELPDIDFEDDLPDDGVKTTAAAAAASGGGGGRGGGIALSSSTGRGCPGLQEALQQLGPCWEEAWLLAHHLRLLPSNGVLTVDAAGAPAPQLVALMQLLLLSRAQLQSLYAAVKQQLLEPTTADAGAAQQPPPAAGSGRGRQQGQKDRRPGPTSKSEPAAAQQQVAASAIQEVLGQVEAPLLQRALQHLCRLMVSRYTCSLEQDEALLQQLEQLPPRKAAAVVARAAEKRCWAAFGKAVADPEAVEGLSAVGVAAVQQGVAALTAKRAAAAQKRQQRRERRRGEEHLSDAGEDSSSSGEESGPEGGSGEASSSSGGSKDEDAHGTKKRCRGVRKQPGNLPRGRRAGGLGQQQPKRNAAGAKHIKDGALVRSTNGPARGAVVETFQFKFDV